MLGESSIRNRILIRRERNTPLEPLRTGHQHTFGVQQKRRFSEASPALRLIPAARLDP
jgi:hypothetical protein